MNRCIVVVSVAACTAGTSQAQPNISEAGLFSLGVSINTLDQTDDFFLSANGAELAPLTVNESASIDEPTPLTGIHEASAMGMFEAVGNEWTGSGSLFAALADGIDPALDVPGTGVGSSTFIRSTATFTLADATPVLINASATVDFDGPDDAFDLDGLFLGFDRDDGTDVFDAELIGFSTSGTQTLNQQIVLPAGSYSFAAFANAAAVETVDVQSIDVNFDFSITFIPTPATASLLGLACLAATRRRREQPVTRRALRRAARSHA